MKDKIFKVVSVLFSLMMINGGLNKFFNYIPVPADMPAELARDNAALMEIVWLMPLIASVEVAGGLLLLFSKTRAVGALLLLPIVAGIVLTHAMVEPSGLPIALSLAAILFWIMYENRSRYKPLLGS